MLPDTASIVHDTASIIHDTVKWDDHGYFLKISSRQTLFDITREIFNQNCSFKM